MFKLLLNLPKQFNVHLDGSGQVVHSFSKCSGLDSTNFYLRILVFKICMHRTSPYSFYLILRCCGNSPRLEPCLPCGLRFLMPRQHIAVLSATEFHDLIIPPGPISQMSPHICTTHQHIYGLSGFCNASYLSASPSIASPFPCLSNRLLSKDYYIIIPSR